MSKMTVAQLPPELWRRVFCFVCEDKDPEQDCPWAHFWITARQVCRSWRADIASTYLDVFLRNPKRTIIHFDCDWGYVGDGKCFFALDMTYDRLDKDDKARVVFKEGDDPDGTAGFLKSEDMDYKQEYAEVKYEGVWRDNLETYLDGGFEFTPYVISINGCSHDSDLPGLRFNTKRREISFEWEAMLNAFCVEYADMDNRLTTTLEQYARSGRESMAAARGQQDRLALMMAAFKDYGDIRLSCLKAVRRHRIRKHYMKEYGPSDLIDNLDIDENYERAQLMRIQHAAGVGKDEEDEEEDEEDAVGADFADEFESEVDDEYEEYEEYEE